MNRLKRLIVLVLVAFLLVPIGAGAQQEVTLEEVNVVLWPEYDRPGTLIIYRIKLASDVALPTTLSFSIPAAAGEPNAVAELAVDGNLYNVVYDRELHGDRAVIMLTATMPEIQLEYYDPNMALDEGQRSFNYTWLGDYAVDNLSFEVQEPLAAEEFYIEPSLGSGSIGRDGLRYYGADVGSLGKGETFGLSLGYHKNTDSLSVEIGPGLYPQPSTNITQSSQGRVNLNIWLRVLASIFVLLLLAGGVFWLLRVRKSGPAAAVPARTKRGRRGASVPEPEAPADKGLFCHQCGKRASDGDAFCRACGTRLRVGNR